MWQPLLVTLAADQSVWDTLLYPCHLRWRGWYHPTETTVGPCFGILHKQAQFNRWCHAKNPNISMRTSCFIAHRIASPINPSVPWLVTLNKRTSGSTCPWKISDFFKGTRERFDSDKTYTNLGWAPLEKPKIHSGHCAHDALLHRRHQSLHVKWRGLRNSTGNRTKHSPQKFLIFCKTSSIEMYLTQAKFQDRTLN